MVCGTGRRERGGAYELIAESAAEMVRFGSLTLLVSCDDVFGTAAWVSDDTWFRILKI